MSTAEQLLAPYIAGEAARENGDIDAHCPLHEDKRRSAVFNFEEEVWYCNAEGIGGTLKELLEQRDSWLPPPDGATTAAPKQARTPEELPSEAMLAGWSRALLASPVALEQLQEVRGLWRKTVEYWEIGYDREHSRYTIPVRDPDGKLVNVRFYQLNPPAGRRKIWGVTGHNQPALYPFKAIEKSQPGDPVIVCEGELDAIITNQMNFRAVTRTAAAKVWKPLWNKWFKDRIVYVCHDMDNAGQDANRKVARSLAKVAREVRIIRLPYPVTDKHGKDLTDWWLEHDADADAFRRLLDEAQPYDSSPSRDTAPRPGTTMDAIDARNSGQPIEMTVTIAGREQGTYTIPRRVEYRCTRDMGAKCEVCPMKAEGEMSTLIAGSDPLILELVGANNKQTTDLLRQRIGAVKCPRLLISRVEEQSVERLQARPSMDQKDKEEGWHSITITNVGHHDTESGLTARVVGAGFPNPRTNATEFLAWDLARTETSIDRFEMTPDLYEQLRVFQPRRKQAPLKKLAEIVRELEQHVTHIYGRPHLHAAMDLVWHSALQFEFDHEVRRGWTELLVVGDTRTGKSEVANRLANFYGQGTVVSCEAATFAGLVGGADRPGDKSWVVTWGTIPLNDRRLVVLDEISGLHDSIIGGLSSVRSSGVAEIEKIVKDRAPARTRMIWMGNPRAGQKMSAYPNAVMAIPELVRNYEDQARFDICMALTEDDVDIATIHNGSRSTRSQIGQGAAASLVLWAWSRRPDQIVFTPDAHKAVYAEARQMGSRYDSFVPLVVAADIRMKIARLAVALAARLFSTDPRGDRIIVRSEHVHAVVRFMDKLYAMERFGYARVSASMIADEAAAHENADKARKFLKPYGPLLEHISTEAQGFTGRDVSELLNMDFEEASGLISNLYRMKMIRRVGDRNVPRAAFSHLIREELK